MERIAEAPQPSFRAKAESSQATTASLTGVQRAAVLLVALGTEVAGKVLRHLSDAEVEDVTVAIARLQSIPGELVEAVLTEYREQEQTQLFSGRGGPVFARRALEAAVGTGRAEEIMMKTEAATDVSAFRMLQTLETSHVTNFIQQEHPQTAALILAHLNPRKAADTLSALSPELQYEITYRLATMRRIRPELLRDVEDVIRHQIGSVFGTNRSSTGGAEVVAEVLDHADRATERAIMDEIRKRDAGLAGTIRDLMFVFDDLVRISDRALQRLLADVDQRDLALALRATSDELKEKVLRNLSERAAAVIQEEMDLVGPVRVSEVEKAQRVIVQVAQELEDRDEIALSHAADETIL